MDLEPSDEQRMLAESLDGLLDRYYDPNARLALLHSELGWSRDMWRRYAELGVLGLAFDEQYGGAGMGIDEQAVVAESFGRVLALEPYLPSVVLGGGLVAAAGSPAQKAVWLPAVADGSLLLAFAHLEPGARWSLTDVACTATPAGEKWILNGQKSTVPGGDCADQLVVTARTPSGSVGLFLTDATTAGIRRNVYPMQDGVRGADILFTGAEASALGEPADGLDTVRSVLDTATALLCAEAVGAMERMLWLTVDYLKTRVQFGQPIARFQVLQHRAADMYVSLEQARSMAQVARLALAVDPVDPLHTRRRTVQAAKVQIDLAARHIGQEAVQLHGGIGMTMEYPVGHYLRRVTVIARTFADTDVLLDEVGRGGGLIPAG